MRSMTLLVISKRSNTAVAHVQHGRGAHSPCARGSLLLKISARSAGHVRGIAALVVMHLTDCLWGFCPVAIKNRAHGWCQDLPCCLCVLSRDTQEAWLCRHRPHFTCRRDAPEGGRVCRLEVDGQTRGHGADRLEGHQEATAWRTGGGAAKNPAASLSDGRDMMVADGLSHAACAMRTILLCDGLEKWMLGPGDMRNARGGEAYGGHQMTS